MMRYFNPGLLKRAGYARSSYVENYWPAVGEYERDRQSVYDITPLRDKMLASVENLSEATFPVELFRNYDKKKKEGTLTREESKDWNARLETKADAMRAANAGVVAEYNKRRNAILDLDDAYKALHNTSLWKRYTPWVGGGALLGGGIGGLIGHKKDKTLLGTLIGAGTGAGVGGLGRFLYEKYKDYSLNKQYKDILSKNL